MKVSEFKNLGLEFVKRDVIRGFVTKDRYVVNEVIARDIRLGDYQDADVIEFAWRENTGKMPSYTGKSDAVIGEDGYDDNTTIMCSPVSGFDWSIDRQCKTLRWRPSLIEDVALQKPAFHEKDKPAFTQAMADDGELPPVGSLFFDVDYSSKTPVLAVGHLFGKVVNALFYDDEERVEYFHTDQGRCRPINGYTRKESHVNFMAKIFGQEGSALVNELFEKLYDDGYRKLTHEQLEQLGL